MWKKSEAGGHYKWELRMFLCKKKSEKISLRFQTDTLFTSLKKVEKTDEK
jgi:hypothetical protein